MAKTKRSTRTVVKPFCRILSIDGGGIRGILPGQILVMLEKILQQESRRADARIAEYFDLIAGTSTGGILACIMLAPDDKKKRPRFSAAEAVSLYIDRGDEVFDLSLWQRIRSLGGVRDEKYSSAGLMDALNDYFHDLKLSELLKPCMITAYDIRNRRAHFFRQHDAVAAPWKDFYVKDVARATSAAPTYFEPARVKSLTNVPYPLIDGGLFANNPALCAYAEARNFPDKPTAANMLILSLGTGEEKKSYPYQMAKDWGLLEWAVPVIDIMMSGVSETVHYQLREIYRTIKARKDYPLPYLRIEPSLGAATKEMDDASPENLIALRDAGQKAAEDNVPELRKFARQLIAAGKSPARKKAKRNAPTSARRR